MTLPAPDREADSLPTERSVFSWRVNLLVFGILVAVVLVLFFLQLRRINDDFKDHSLEQARMMAGIIQENIQNGLFATQLLDTTITIFLNGSGNFAAYLDSIEPFSEDELTLFAQEAGLAGITIIRSNQTVSGPDNWFSGETTCRQPYGRLSQDHASGLAFTLLPLARTDPEGKGCLLVGLDISEIITLRQRTELKTLLTVLTAFPGIEYVRMEETGSDEGVLLLETGRGSIIESRLQTTAGSLVVGLDARYYTRRIAELRKQFFSFAGLLCILGLLSSWLLYRYQQSELQRTWEFERALAQRHEEAALGRATATITHEIRNPLNAIHMGLQRLRLESGNLDREQKELLAAMGEATRRTDGIISNLKRFTAPLQLDLQTVQPALLLEQTMQLYRSLARQQSIAVHADLDRTLEIRADPLLLGELFENLLKNGLEAQPDGGSININCFRDNGNLVVRLSNGGCLLSDSEIKTMTEPYFTTKTRGTGLGLALAKRIAEAHGGRLTLARGESAGELVATVLFPA